MSDLVFWCCLALAGYAFAGYPALAIAMARRARCHGTPLQRSDWPGLTVVIAARNEAARIPDRIRNLLASHYPAAKLRVLVVDDGSDDATAAAAESVGDPRVRVLRMPVPLGKAAALNAALATVDTPVTVFADARQRFQADALAELASRFDAPDVGAVTGELLLEAAPDSSDPVAGNGAYWKLERRLRAAEAKLGWAHGASGAIYAIHTVLFRPMPPGLLLDDVFTPLQVVRQGLRVNHAPGAIALDLPGTHLRHEFRRKLRTLAGNWQLLAAQPWLLLPWRNPVFFAWASHKFVRLLAPWALLLALLASALSPSPLLQALFWLQLAAYGMAVATVLFPAVARRIPLAGTAGSFVTLNAAALLSLPLWLGRRDLAGLWKR
jgi:cellulose synthase/poly-beta-1,6-N-acetylglucosamine synthase-like glycosyltransferase